RSTKNSPALKVIASVERRAHVRAWDPAIQPGELQIAAEVVSDPYAAANGADGLVVMADWDDFARADFARVRDCMRRPVVIDCAGVVDARRAEQDGLQYVGMGK